VPPGTYQLRVAARDRGGKTGSVHYDLVVPDFAREPLSVSGLILASAASGAVPTAAPSRNSATCCRRRDNGAGVLDPDEIAVLAEVYDNRVRSPLGGHLGHVKAEGRVQVFTNSERRSSKELGGARAVTDTPPASH